MSVRVDKDRFAAYLPHLVDEALRPAVSNYIDIDPKLAPKVLGPDVLATYERLLASGREKVGRNELATAYVAEVKEAVIAAAGTNRWLSIAESRVLPPTTRKAYASFRWKEQYSRDYAGALDEPFPGGRVDHHLFFERYLPMVRKRGMLRLIEEGDVLARLRTFAERSGKQDEAVTVSFGGRTVVARAKEEGLEVTGRSGVAIEYEVQSVHERLRAMARKLPAATRSVLGRDEKRTESQNINDRFGRGSDHEDMLTLALGLDAELGGGERSARLQEIGADITRVHDEACGEYFERTKAVEALREIAANMKELGEQSLGDADLDLALSKRLVQTTYDDDDEEKQVVLVRGRGPLLTMENNASGAAWAIHLDPLARGELVVSAFNGREPSGTVRVGADGKVESMADFRSLYGLTFDIEWAKHELREMRAEQKKG